MNGQLRGFEQWAYPITFVVLALPLWVLIVAPDAVVAIWTSEVFWLWLTRIAQLFGIASLLVAVLGAIFGCALLDFL
jgi:hypothetical protein